MSLIPRENIDEGQRSPNNENAPTSGGASGSGHAVDSIITSGDNGQGTLDQFRLQGINPFDQFGTKVGQDVRNFQVALALGILPPERAICLFFKYMRGVRQEKQPNMRVPEYQEV